MKPVAGAQLYTVREHTQTASDLEKTLDRVASIGYTAVQLSGLGPVDPAKVGKLVERAGIKVAATHVPWNRFLDDLDAVIEEHQCWGCSHAAIGGLPSMYRSPEGLDRFLREVQPVARKLAGAGLDFSYHNHSRELVRCDGDTWLARLYDAAGADVVKAEIDTYWIQAGGGDPAAWIRRCAGREPLLHLKDMVVQPDGEQRFAEVGEGNLNWPAILEAAEDGGVEYLLVEQDRCYDRDPFDALAVSYRNLQRMGYA